MNKKENERTIFDLVYKPIFFKDIISSEKPDFICELNDGNEIGVEITEYFSSEVAARLNKIPGYVNQLLSVGEYRHRDDIEKLRVEEITYSSYGKEPGKKINAIILELLTPSMKIELLQKVITKKIEKLDGYQDNMSAVDLIIYDANNEFIFSSFEELFSIISTEPLTEKIKGTRFREIFLVTSVSHKTRVYAPLKANLLISEILSFEYYFKEYYREERKILMWEFYDQLFGYLIGKGFGSALYKQNEVGYSVNFGSVCFSYGNSMKKLFNETIYDIDSRCSRLDTKVRAKKIEKGFSDFYRSPENKVSGRADLYFSVN